MIVSLDITNGIYKLFFILREKCFCDRIVVIFIQRIHIVIDPFPSVFTHNLFTFFFFSLSSTTWQTLKERERKNEINAIAKCRLSV